MPMFISLCAHPCDCLEKATRGGLTIFCAHTNAERGDRLIDSQLAYAAHGACLFA